MRTAAVPTPPYAKSAREKCPRQDSNLYAVSDTSPSNWPVYQFQHVGNMCHKSHTNPCSGRDSNPHEVNPHRVLNPARLPIPPPEQIRAWAPVFGRLSGAEGNRTPDLLNAIQALSRLSYGPNAITCNLSNNVSSGADGTRTRDLRCDRPAL